MKVIICCISFLLLSICPSLLAMEGTGVALKVSLSGKIYKRFSFVLEEDIRPRDDFREAGWFLTTGEINYRILPNLRAGAGYMSLVRYKASEEVRNRYYLYASGSHRFGAFKIAIRERFQSTYRKNCLHPTNYLRSMLTLSYRIASSRFEPFIYVEPFNNVATTGRCVPTKSAIPLAAITGWIPKITSNSTTATILSTYTTRSTTATASV